MSADKPLPLIEAGERDDPRPPVVLIHGFAGDALAWAGLQPLIAPRRSIAFDLPGHGKARDWPEIGHAGVLSRAVLDSLDRLELPAVHLVGHSLGGAVAALVALKAPGRVASLTLLAPGGFGPAINARLLRRFARASTAAELAPVVEGFFGFRTTLPAELVPLMVAMRSDRTLLARFAEIAEAILDGDGQKTLPMDALADLPCPVRLVWGDEDNVVPVAQVANAPETFARHVLSGVGHLPHVERAELVARLVLQTAASGEP